MGIMDGSPGGLSSDLGGSLVMRGGHLHPLNLAIGIARAAIAAGATIHPHSAATRLARSGTGWRVTTARGSVTADTVLLACGGYLEGMNRAVDAHVDRKSTRLNSSH